MALGSKTGLPIEVKSSGVGLKTSYDLKKWNTSVFSYSMTSSNFVRREEIIL